MGLLISGCKNDKAESPDSRDDRNGENIASSSSQQQAIASVDEKSDSGPYQSFESKPFIGGKTTAEDIALMDNAQLKQHIQELEQENRKLAMANANLQTRNSGLTGLKEDKDEELNAIVVKHDGPADFQKMERLRQEIKHLKSKVERRNDYESLYEQESARARALADDLDEMKKKRDNWEANYHDLENENNKKIRALERKNGELQAQLTSTASATLGTAPPDVESAEKLAIAEKEVDDGALEEAQNRNEQLELVVRELRTERDDLKKKNRTLAAELASFEAVREEMRSQVQELTSKLANTTAENQSERLEFELLIAQEELEDKTRRLKSAEQAREEMEKECERKLQEMRHANETLSQTQGNYGEKELEIQRVREQLEERDRDLESAQRKLTRLSLLEREKKDLEDEMDNAKEKHQQQISQLVRDLEETKMSAQQVQNESTSELEMENRQLNEDLNEERARTTELAKQLEEAQQALTNNATSGDTGVLQQQVEEYRSKYEQAKEDLDDWRVRVQDAKFGWASFKTPKDTQDFMDGLFVTELTNAYDYFEDESLEESECAAIVYMLMAGYYRYTLNQQQEIFQSVISSHPMLLETNIEAVSNAVWPLVQATGESKLDDEEFIRVMFEEGVEGVGRIERSELRDAFSTNADLQAYVRGCGKLSFYVVYTKTANLVLHPIGAPQALANEQVVFELEKHADFFDKNQSARNVGKVISSFVFPSLYDGGNLNKAYLPGRVLCSKD